MIRFVPLRRAWPLALLALGGCQTPRAVDPPPAASTAAAATPLAAPSAPASRPTLLDEHRRLSALFQGTPVVFTMQAGGVLRIDVPLRFCFDRGQTVAKPALVAVLDRVTQSQRDTKSRLQINVAGDAPVKPSAAASAASRTAAAAARGALGTRRANVLRDRFASQGIGADRTSIVDGDSTGVRLWITEAPAP